jgi:hypothetical protein
MPWNGSIFKICNCERNMLTVYPEARASLDMYYKTKEGIDYGKGN